MLDHWYVYLFLLKIPGSGISKINDFTTIQEPPLSRGLKKISQIRFKNIKPIRLITDR